MNAEKFVGLSKKAAQNLAEENNMIFRLVSVDGKQYLGRPTDTRDDRVCIEINDRLVTSATID